MIISLNLNRGEVFVLLAIVNMWQGAGRTLRRLCHCDRWDAQRFHRSVQWRLPAFPTENTDRQGLLAALAPMQLISQVLLCLQASYLD